MTWDEAWSHWKIIDFSEVRYLKDRADDLRAAFPDGTLHNLEFAPDVGLTNRLLKPFPSWTYVVPVPDDIELCTLAFQLENAIAGELRFALKWLKDGEAQESELYIRGRVGELAERIINDKPKYIYFG
jgi:hypothetical protein